MRSFGCVFLLYRKKDDYEKNLVFDLSDGDGGWLDADDGLCCRRDRGVGDY